MSGLTQTATARALKAACEDLVGSIGGEEAAADHLDIEKSELQRCVSVHSFNPKRWLCLPRIVVLERLAPRPLVTMLMCKLAGGQFVRLPKGAAAEGELGLRVLELVREVGDVSARMIEASADGEVTAREAETIEAEFDEVIAKAVEGRSVARALQGKGAVEITAQQRDAG